MAEQKTPATVAEMATEPNELPLNGTTLLGTMGTDQAPRALVRMGSGKIQQVEPGDRLSVGQVVAIETGRLILKRRSGTMALTMPQG